MTRSITHLFDDYGQAKNAVDALERAGFTPSEVSVVSRIAMMAPWLTKPQTPAPERRLALSRVAEPVS